jgi:hypothetical protein
MVIWGFFFKSNFIQLNIFFKGRDLIQETYPLKAISPKFYITINKVVIWGGVLVVYFQKG